MNQLVTVTAIERLQDNAEEQQRNQEAESAWVRRQVWGEKQQEPGEVEAMHRQTILGDVNNPAPTIVDKASWLAPLLLGLAIPGAVGLGALGAMALTKPEPVEQKPIEDETVTVGLGRLDTDK